MHLVGELACGVRGAESGTARIYKYNQGTQAATWYSGFNAENPSTAAVSLDENGGATVYVGTLARVLVEDSDGNTVRDFVSAAGDDGVEVRSPSFTGTDYVTSVQAAGNPTTLATALDALVSSFGAEDFKVLFRGNATNLSSAIRSADIFFNVKAYGATGDGVTDDTGACQNALDAAYDAGGGIVFFPAGTYFTDGLVVGEGVSLMGVGGGASVIEWDDPSSPNAAIAFDDLGGATAGNYQFMSGLKLQPRSSTATDVALFVDTPLLGLEVRGCHIKTGNGQFFNTIESCVVDFYDCYFDHSDATTSNGSFSSCFARFYSCLFVVGSTLTADLFLSDGSLFLNNCYFDVSAHASGTLNVVSVEGLLRMQDCQVTDNGGGTVKVIDVDNTATLADIRILERGNQFGNNTPYDMELVTLATGFSAAEVVLDSRRNVTAQYETDAGADVAVDSRYETVFIEVSDTTAFDITVSGPQPAGSDLYIIVENTSGNTSGNISFNDSDVRSAHDSTPFTLGDGTRRAFHFKSILSEEDSALRWTQVGAGVTVPA